MALRKRGGDFLNLLQKEGASSEKCAGGWGGVFNIFQLWRKLIIQKDFFLGDFDIDELKFELGFN